MRRIGYNRLPLVRDFLNNLFILHYQLGDYPAALDYMKMILADVGADSTSKVLPFFYGNLGETYLKLRNTSKAKEAFLKSISFARQQHDPVWEGISSGNYGYALQLEGQYVKALPFFYRDIQLNLKLLPDNTAITYVFLANSLLHLDSTEKAGIYLKQAPQLKPDWILSSFGLHYYKAMALYFQKTGNYRSAFLYQDSLLRLSDSLRIKNDLAHFKSVTLTFKEERLLAETRLHSLKPGNCVIPETQLLFFYC